MNSSGLSRGFRCLNCTLQNLYHGQQRTFIASPARHRHGAVPSFSPTSSPELDELLLAFRNKVFLPSHLSKSHRDLIFKGKLQRALDAEPVYATIAGEKFQLQHLDKTQDLPGRNHIKKAIRLMKERKDWDNLPSLLKGLKDARRLIDPVYLTPLTRKAGQAGRIDIILECARRVSDTGFRLRDPLLLGEIMAQLQDKAVKSNWASKETTQALSWAEMFMELCEDKRHATGQSTDGEHDVRLRPEVVGILLQLSAASAIISNGGEDRDGRVAQYTSELLKLSATNWLNFDQDYWLESSRRKAPNPTEVASSRYLVYMVPTLHGAKLAAALLGPIEGLSNLVATLEVSVAVQRETLLNSDNLKNKEAQPRGLESYDRLLGANAVTPVSRQLKSQTATETTAE